MMSIPTNRIALWILGFFCWLASAGSGDAQIPGPAPGTDSLRRGTHPVWVDRDSETVVASDKEWNRSDVSDRHSSIRTVTTNRSWWDQLFRNTSTNSGSSNWPDFFENFFFGARIFFTGLVLLVLGWVLYYFLRIGRVSARWSRRSQVDEPEDLESQRARISDLPFELEQPLLGLKSLAERSRQQRDFSKAIVYLFSYLLVELDKNQCIRLERGKTNGNYVRELRGHAGLQNYLRSTVRLFESTYFGRHPTDEQSFLQLWNQLPQFESYVADQRRRVETAASVPSPPTVVGVSP